MKTINSILISILMATALSACAHKSAGTPPEFSYRVNPVEEGITPVGRVYFIVGYYQTIAGMTAEPYNLLPDILHDENYEVVIIGWPSLGDNMIDGATFAPDQGKSYVLAFQAYMKNLNETLPPMPKTIIGGFSFGGLHAVWANEVVPNDGVFGNLSVVTVSKLSEFAGVNTTYADMPSHPIPANYWLSYGDLDTRTDGPATAALYAGEPFLHEYPGAHVTTTQQQLDIAEFIESIQ